MKKNAWTILMTAFVAFSARGKRERADTREKDAESISRYIRSEIDDALSRRTSFDNRTFAMITATFAVSTFYFALRTQVLTGSKPNGAYFFFYFAGLGLLAASVFAAIGAAAPGSLRAQSEDKLADYLLRIANGTSPTDLDLIVAKAEIGQLRALNLSNRRKGRFSVLQLALMTLGSVALSISVILFP